MGSKSSSLSKLGANPAIAGFVSSYGGTLAVPGSSALPFSAFDRAIRADAACLEKVALAAAAVTAADEAGDAYLRREALKVVRDTIVFQLTMPADLEPVLAAQASPQPPRLFTRRACIRSHNAHSFDSRLSQLRGKKNKRFQRRCEG